MLPREIPVVLVLIGLVAVSATVFMGGAIDAYPNTNITTGTWNTTYNKIDDAYADIQSTKESVSAEESGFLDAVGNLITGTGSVISLMVNSFSLLTDLPYQILKDLNVPSPLLKPLQYTIIVIVLSGIIFAIISAVLKQKI
jgi:hypothetical protein